MRLLTRLASPSTKDRSVIEQQYQNMRAFGHPAEWVDIHVDVGATRARRIVQRLAQSQPAAA